MAQAQQQSFTDMQPIPPAQTFSNVVPIDGSGAAPSGTFWDKVQAKLPGTADTGLKGAVNHIQDTLHFLKSAYDVSAPGIAQQIYKKLSGQPNELKQLPGKMVTAFALSEEPEFEGDVAPAAQSAASEAAPGGVIKPALSKIGSAATSVGQSVDPDLVGLVSPRAAHALRLASRVGKVATKYGTEAAPEATAEAAVPDFWGKGKFGTPVEQWGQRTPAVEESPQPAAMPTGAAPATEAPQAAAAETPSGAGMPRTLAGESALRQILPGNKADLMKIAKSRGISTAREAQLVPGAANKLLIDKIVDDFSPEELEAVRSQYIEETRMGHSVPQISETLESMGLSKAEAAERAQEAWNVMKKQAYFPELQIRMKEQIRAQQTMSLARGKIRVNPVPETRALGDLAGAIKNSAKAASRKLVTDPTTGRPEFSDVVAAKTGIPEEDLTDVITRSVEIARAARAARKTGTN